MIEEYLKTIANLAIEKENRRIRRICKKNCARCSYLTSDNKCSIPLLETYK